MNIKEFPIAFTPENVQRILAGTKTQTRRVMKPNAIFRSIMDHRIWVPPTVPPTANSVQCPYGQIGDRLWVRHDIWEPTRDTPWSRGGNLHCWNPITHEIVWADGTTCGDVAGVDTESGAWKQTRSSLMPRWACRLMLEITAIRIERVQDITDNDARAEGVPDREAFRQLWDSINAPRGYVRDSNPLVWWANNPLVWAITFRRLNEEGS